ncbi:hypothetical protein J6590_060942 [Homalodisca vitripennis]|nr:hypothetical protein J6590_060942 [Homalodisca vitripennis]
MKKFNARGSAARDPHGIKQITVGPPYGIKQITMFIRENVECLDSSFTITTTIKCSNNKGFGELWGTLQSENAVKSNLVKSTSMEIPISDNSVLTHTFSLISTVFISL